MGSKKNGGFVYSTNDDFFDGQEEEEEGYPSPENQRVTVRLDRKMRKGKTVTLVEGVQASDQDMKELARDLKQSCGTGGSVKDGIIEIQGDKCQKCMDLLEKRGYNVRKIGG